MPACQEQQVAVLRPPVKGTSAVTRARCPLATRRPLQLPCTVELPYSIQSAYQWQIHYSILFTDEPDVKPGISKINSRRTVAARPRTCRELSLLCTGSWRLGVDNDGSLDRAADARAGSRPA